MRRFVRLSRWQSLVVTLLLFVPRASAEDAVEARMRRDITFLAADACEGRGVDTKGINLAADYIATEFQQAGLLPGGPNGSFFQPFSIAGTNKLDGVSAVVLTGPLGQTIELRQNEHFTPVGFSGPGKLAAPVVFLGYGASADEIGYDDFRNVNVAGKVVVILRQTPRTDNAYARFNGDKRDRHAALVTKLVLADQHKAAAVIFVNDRDMAKNADSLMDFADTARGGSPVKIPVLHLRRDVLDAMLRTSVDKSLRDLEADIDREVRSRSMLLPGWTAALDVRVTRPQLAVKNIVGVVEGRGPLAKETVVVGAHYDHLGYGGRNSGSLARDQKTPAIHHGADDNGSGTTTLIELARRLGKLQGHEGRRIVLIAFSGEEEGLLGSEFYCKHPLFPLEDTVAMLNMDMVGRVRQDMTSHKEKLIVYGTGTEKSFAGMIDRFNQKYDFQIQKVPGANMPGERSSSDHASFYRVNVPVLFFFTGNHPDYHRPTDTADKINVTGMRKVADFVEELTHHLDTVAERPRYVKVAAPAPSHGGAGVGGPRVRIGILPDYGDDQEGVLLSGAADGGPAAKAGLKEGDRIVELGGKPVKNIEVYMVLLGSLKKGEPVDVGILREGKKVMVKVVPE
jgi:hypothetical protein